MKEFEDVINSLLNQLRDVNYNNGDISDVGNEIGIAIGEHLSTKEHLDDFITGLKHGISLKNGTH